MRIKLQRIQGILVGLDPDIVKTVQVLSLGQIALGPIEIMMGDLVVLICFVPDDVVEG